LSIPNLGDENSDVKDVTIETSLDGKGARGQTAEEFKAVMRGQLRAVVREKIALFLEWIKGFTLPNPPNQN
jgi:hypothetical protein